MIVSWFFIFMLRITIVLNLVVLYNYKIGKLIIVKQ
ncbi:unknown [Coprococcus eutactus CAG:665]|nr:unknown [Coprococcus eutactus CAG:665]